MAVGLSKAQHLPNCFETKKEVQRRRNCDHYNESVHVHFDKILPRVIFFKFLGNILTIRVNFPRISEFLATTLPSSAADEVSGAADG